MKKSFKGKNVALAIAILIFFSCKKEASLTAGPPSQTPAPAPAPKDSVYTVLSTVTRSVNNKIGGYYLGLPSNYDKTTQSYPLLVYMHGAGQFGNGSSDLGLLLKDGVAQVINDKKFPGTFTVNSKNFSFIVLMPQVKSFPGAGDINDCIEMAKKAWRIDTTRIYVSGLSAGSMASCDLAAEVPFKIAALVPMAGVPDDYAATNKCQKIAFANVPVWAFHSADDPQVKASLAQGFIATIASLNPGIPPRLTIWPSGGHDAWTRAVDPSYKENGLNIYEWMLQYHR